MAAGTVYMYYSYDQITWTRIGGLLTTSCVVLGTITNVIKGTVIYFKMFNSTQTTGYATIVNSAGGGCLAPTTSCTIQSATINLPTTVYLTGNNSVTC